MQRKPESAAEPAGATGEATEDSVAIGALSVTGIVFVLFTAGVYAYANYGGPFVNRLSGELGEIIAARGVTAQKAGQIDDAIRAFRLALQKGFGDARQKYWAQVRLADALLQTSQFTEAAECVREAMAFDASDPKLHYVLTASLWQSKHLEDALTAAKTWLELVRPKGGLAAADALWYQGTIYGELGQREKALEAFLEGARFEPSSRDSYHAAELLHEFGRDPEAIKLLDAYLPHATGDRVQRAKELRGAIAAPSAGH